jgi:hypothetical protein
LASNYKIWGINKVRKNGRYDQMVLKKTNAEAAVLNDVILNWLEYKIPGF